MYNVNGGDIELAINSDTISNNLEYFPNMTSAIDNFCDNQHFNTDIWNGPKSKLTEYATSISTGMTVITTFLSIVKEVLTKLKESLGDYAETVDISKEDEIYNNLNNAKKRLNNLKNDLAKAESTPIAVKTESTDGLGEESTTYTFDYELINSLKTSISNLEIEVADLEEYYNLIVRVKAAYKAAEEAIVKAYEEVDEYAHTKSVTPNGKCIYNNK